ncbi:MAG: metallophosphoesterase family protein [Anaerolineae bacterium]|nr:metallophosphoesterase family protein [Anaerolineae bacterium]MDH7472415.1 metallophosphoesterase family protein [Anaerolineae bacterium]
MRYAILSDIHGKLRALEAALADARRLGVQAIISLGDVGSDACFDLLRSTGAVSVFGNWEVSRWGELSVANQQFVLGMTPMVAGDDFLAVHAAPWWPEGLNTVVDFMDYMLTSGIKWRKLFPYLDEDEDARWQAVAELENRDKQVLFHGHTHHQEVWRIGPTGRMIRLKNKNITLDARARYLVGVGSLSRPEGGAPPGYALFDDMTRTIELREVR